MVADGSSVAACSRRRPRVYTRRWSIEPNSDESRARAVLIQVLVTSIRNRGRADQGAVTRLPGEARLVTIKVRKPR